MCVAAAAAIHNFTTPENFVGTEIIDALPFFGRFLGVVWEIERRFMVSERMKIGILAAAKSVSRQVQCCPRERKRVFYIYHQNTSGTPIPWLTSKCSCRNILVFRHSNQLHPPINLITACNFIFQQDSLALYIMNTIQLIIAGTAQFKNISK